MKRHLVKNFTVIFSSFAILAVACFFFLQRNQAGAELQGIVINEVCCANVSVAADNHGKYRNYVELYNPSDVAQDLSDVYLSNKKKKPKKFSLKGVTVPAHGFTLIWLGGKDKNGEEDTESRFEADEIKSEEEQKNTEVAACAYTYPIDDTGVHMASSNPATFDLKKTGGELYLTGYSRAVVQNEDTASETKQSGESQGETTDPGEGAENDGLAERHSSIRIHVSDQIAVPELKYDTSYSRITDGSSDWHSGSCSAGVSNNGTQEQFTIRLSEPVFSEESGFYDTDFTLTLSAGANQEIWYTTDGSDPVPGQGTTVQYTGAITVTDVSSNPNVYSDVDKIQMPHNYRPDYLVDKATVIRAVAYNPRTGSVSEPATNTYFVGYQNRSDYDGFPIVSLVTDPYNLFDYYHGIYIAGVGYEEYVEKGGFEGMKSSDIPANISSSGGLRWRFMYTNTRQKGRLSERPVSFTYFNSDHEVQFTQTLGMRIAGESSRFDLQESLNFFPRKAYDTEGDGWMTYPFFTDNTPMSKFRLRHQDDNGFSMDAFLMSLVGDDRQVGKQRSIPTVVFLDGEYWGIYYLREQFHADYFENYYGTDPDNLWLMKNYIQKIGPEDVDVVRQYDLMLQQMTVADMSDPVQFGVVERNVNLQSLIDFYCLNLYADNEDMEHNHNLARWRTGEAEDSEYGDAKWNYLLYDMDKSIGSDIGDTGDASINSIQRYKDIDPLLYLPGYLSVNEEFRKQYCLTMMDVANTTYSYKRVHAALEQWHTLLKQQAVDTVRRFYTTENPAEDFEKTYDQIESFFKDRRKYMEQYLAEDQGLTGEIVPISVKVKAPGSEDEKAGSDADTSLSASNMGYKVGTTGGAPEDSGNLAAEENLTAEYDSEETKAFLARWIANGSASDETGADYGTITVNTAKLTQGEMEEGWTGEYFGDFEVTVKADAEDGYRFAGWTVEQNGRTYQTAEEELTLDLTKGAVQLTADYEGD